MAYGARLESVLGASPRGFESPILRHQSGTVRFRIFYLLPLFPAPAYSPDLRSLPAPLFLDDAAPHQACRRLSRSTLRRRKQKIPPRIA